MTNKRYPYTHHGPAVHGSKLMDYFVSEVALREDRPELFDDNLEPKVPTKKPAPE